MVTAQETSVEGAGDRHLLTLSATDNRKQSKKFNDSYLKIS